MDGVAIWYLSRSNWPRFQFKKTLNFAKGLKLKPLDSSEAVCSHRGMTVASTVDRERVGCEFVSDEADF